MVYSVSTCSCSSGNRCVRYIDTYHTLGCNSLISFIRILYENKIDRQHAICLYSPLQSQAQWARLDLTRELI